MNRILDFIFRKQEDMEQAYIREQLHADAVMQAQQVSDGR